MSSPRAVLIVFTAWAIVSIGIVMLMLPARDRFGALIVGGLVTLYWMLYAWLERATLRQDEPDERSGFTHLPQRQDSGSSVSPDSRSWLYGVKGGNDHAG